MRRILILAPHYDDETFGCGGTIAKLCLEEDVEVSVGFILDGVSGVPDAKSRDIAMEIRKREAMNAGAVLGIDGFYFLDFEDRGFAYSRGALHEVIRLIRQFRPNSLWFPHEFDGDIEHKVVHQIAKEASWMAASPCFPELGAQAPSIMHILCYEIWTPMQNAQVRVDITSTIKKKRMAINCYRSQLQQTNYRKAILGLNQYRGMASEAQYVEVFQVLRTPLIIPA